MSKNKSLNIIR